MQTLHNTVCTAYRKYKNRNFALEYKLKYIKFKKLFREQQRLNKVLKTDRKNT